jgi:hypothetical protein
MGTGQSILNQAREHPPSATTPNPTLATKQKPIGKTFHFSMGFVIYHALGIFESQRHGSLTKDVVKTNTSSDRNH